MRALIILALVAAFVTIPAAVWLYGQKSVEAELVAALERNDPAAVAVRVDFDKLRAFLKQDLLAKKNDKSPIGSLYARSGPDIHNIDKVVDYYAQPENIAILTYMRNSTFPDIPVGTFIVSRGYAPLYGFSMTFGLPPEALKDSAMRAAAERFQVRAVFRLSGLTWKLAELHAPLFMVPEHTYSQPAVEIFAPQPR